MSVRTAHPLRSKSALLKAINLSGLDLMPPDSIAPFQFIILVMKCRWLCAGRLILRMILGLVLSLSYRPRMLDEVQ